MLLTQAAFKRNNIKIGFVRYISVRLRLKCDGTHVETRFRLSVKWTSPFKLAGESVQSTTGSRDVRISGSNAGHTQFRGSVKGIGYPLYSPVSPSLPQPVRHRVPSRFNWTLLTCKQKRVVSETSRGVVCCDNGKSRNKYK